MTIDAFIAESADELRAHGLWVVDGHEHLWAAHYFQRPPGIPTLTDADSHGWKQPWWQIPFHGRLANIYGYRIEFVCAADPETGLSGAPNLSSARERCEDGRIYLGDFNGINRNQGYWIPDNAPTWRFMNKICNISGVVDPHNVTRATNDIAEAYDWMKAYNQCGEFAPGVWRFVDASK